MIGNRFPTRSEHDHFILRLGSVANFSGTKVFQPIGINVETESVVRFPANRFDKLLVGHLRQANVLDAQILAREHGYDLPAAEVAIAEHFPDGCDSFLPLPLGIPAGRDCELPSCAGADCNLTTGAFQLQHLDAAGTEIQSDGPTLVFPRQLEHAT